MPVIQEGTSFRFVPSFPGERLRVALLRSDDWHHRFLELELARHLDVVGAVVEPGQWQQRRLWRERRYRASVWRRYQGLRQSLTGRAAYRNRYFAALLAESASAVPTVQVDWVNSDEARAELVRLAPDVTVVCGTSFLRPTVLECIDSIFVNLHGGGPRLQGEPWDLLRI